jgi:DNA polymerase-3 subunit delta'
MQAPHPKLQPRLLGRQPAEAQLLADLARGRLAHGWIISGPKGTGKATLAHRFARGLLAGKPADQIAPEDPVWQRINAGSHADLLVVEPLFDAKKDEYAREISVDQTRDIPEFFSKTPGESQWRIVIVDAVDALTTSAANALLKILEEPPPQALLLLISHNPGRLLPTIRSRCRRLSLPALSADDFAQIVAENAPELDSATLTALGQLTDYSPGMALQMHEQGALELYGQIIGLVCGLPSLDPLKLHAFADRVSSGATHANWQLLSRLMLSLLHRIALEQCGLPLDYISSQEKECLRSLAGLYSAACWAVKWQALSDQFSVAERLHLDYKQCVIVLFHSLTGPQEPRIGHAA